MRTRSYSNLRDGRSPPGLPVASTALSSKSLPRQALGSLGEPGALGEVRAHRPRGMRHQSQETSGPRIPPRPRPRQRAVHAPVDGLRALVQLTALLVMRPSARMMSASVSIVHRQIRMVPVAEHTEADEVCLLTLDLGYARTPGTSRRNSFALDLPAVQLLHLVLDRQTVAVPSRNVGRIDIRTESSP